ncbi:NAD-dependent epimerase/dehydratase family protein [Hyphococcus flavus]|uniref:NAD-dependent epimerase/dehydratase family protein n=1 Tax=Hyphococcus flavus TaxID=1866326 RepID=A0AAE9ZDU4_9PROT|nr:NAD-dependent epimerase/dehydratase family protein [Hyphococcus flavus]WDI32731.1 NAD-dependent epimerase/dehydratase family protein [Hyphococcus flavus]
MRFHRRTLLSSAAGAMAMSAARALALEGVAKAAKPLKVLVLGGTNFVGPAIVQRLLARGHKVTLFNRGVTRPYLFPDVEKLRGDRSPDSEDLSALAGERKWDAVIDVWPEHTDKVMSTARMLSESVGYYYFVSSIAVYADFRTPGLTEGARIRTDEPGHYYGGEKARAEEFLFSYLPDRSGSARCHAILGPMDDGWAYHYWLNRFARYEEVLAPGTGGDYVQYTDVRDVAVWTVDCVEHQRLGAYNMTGPPPPMMLKTFLEDTRKALGSNANLTWVDADFLRYEHSVRSFDRMPLWAPLDEDEGFYQISSAKGLRDGMTFRSVAETARDAYRWTESYFFKDVSFPRGGFGISREKEEAVLSAWASR